MRGNGQNRKNGFTMIELMVVIAIIMILAGILAPSIRSVMAAAYASNVQARVSELDTACRMYNTQYGFYPGQHNVNRLTGTNNGPLTGSQLLAEALFLNYDDPNWDGNNGGNHSTTPLIDSTVAAKATWNWTPKFASLNYVPSNSAKNDLIKPATTDSSDRSYSIADRFNYNYLPILYYPARTVDAGGNPLTGQAQFIEDDNKVYLTTTDVRGAARVFSSWTPVDSGNDPATFASFIWDKRFGGTTGAYRSGEFLLIGAGSDRLFGTRNTIKNWND